MCEFRCEGSRTSSLVCLKVGLSGWRGYLLKARNDKACTRRALFYFVPWLFGVEF